MSNALHIALVGNPNVGKTTLFNQLTGLNQKTGNFPGVTVEKKTGFFEYKNYTCEVTDLPGTYSIYPKSPDERVVLDFLLNNKPVDKPSLIVNILDASNIKRNLLLYSQLADMGFPIILAMNMMDVAQNIGVHLDISILSKRLGQPIIKINARTGEGMAELKEAITKGAAPRNTSFYKTPDALGALVNDVKQNFNIITDYRAVLLTHHFNELNSFSADDKKSLSKMLTQYDFAGKSTQGAETIGRYSAIHELLMGVMTKTEPQRPAWSVKLDKYLTHRIYGYVIFLLILFLVFQTIFTWASYPMDMIDAFFAFGNDFLKEKLPEGLATDLLTDGIIAGLGGIVIFIPQIALLFAFITILEETGYMSRVMFIMDKIMRKFGLNGRSVVPLISGVACAVPAIMSTRSIDNWKERLVTIFVTPLMSCSARLPVFTLIISLIIPDTKLGGVLSLQGLMLLLLYVIGVIAVILSATLVNQFVKQKERTIFIMELPVYKWPKLKNVLLAMYDRSKVFVVDAGKIILAISIVLWVLASFGPEEKMATASAKATQELADSLGTTKENLEASLKLEASYAGHLGHFIEPAIRPLGYDWKIGIALITSFAAREVFVGTISTIYTLGSDDAEVETIKQKLSTERDPRTGELIFNFATGISLMLFYLFAMQCMSTLGATYRETKSWKYPMLQLVYMTGLAYIVSFIAYQLLK